MRAYHTGVVVCLVIMLLCANSSARAGNFEREWVHASVTSAVIYWQLGEISSSANSYVEFGTTEKLGKSVERTHEPRQAQLHRLTGLAPATVYYYRMVVLDSKSGQEETSGQRQFTTTDYQDVVRFPSGLTDRPPYVLNSPNTRYVLGRDIRCDATAIEITAENVSLDLDGHTVLFGDNTNEVAYGVLVSQRTGRTVVANGHIVQGRKSGESSAAIASLKIPQPIEIYGISTDVHLKCALPIDLSSGPPAKIHHNHIYSRVTELESRHQPGNTLLLVGGDPIYLRISNVHIHDNLLTEGCHRGIHLREVVPTVGSDPKVEVDHNDIRHHQQYVNGYAIIPSAGADVHHNRITSTGRAIHLNESGIRVHDNYINTRGHMHLSDMPARFRPYWHRKIELHGIKLEGRRVKNCKVYNNFVHIEQYPPVDSAGQGSTADKINNGVYVRSVATALSGSRLVDVSRDWETSRWRGYFVKYSANLPPARIDSNDAATLFGNFSSAEPGEYSIYMPWSHVPPSPLNIACYDPNAMNEVYGNRFEAITHYSKTRHGSYGDSGEWASSIQMVGMNRGPAEPGKYSVYVHDNQFYSNDLFINSYTNVDMAVRIEDNEFTLLKKPHLTRRDNRLRNLGTTLEDAVRAGNNRFRE